VNLYSAYVRLTFNALVTLVLTEKDCFETIVWNYQYHTSDLRVFLAVSFRPSDRQLEKPDGHACYKGVYTIEQTSSKKHRANIELAQAGLLELRSWLKCIGLGLGS